MSNILFPLRCPGCDKVIGDSDTSCPHCGMQLDAPLEKSELEALAQPCLEKAQKALESGGNLKGALDNCDQAIEYTPESAAAHNLRGLVLDAKGKPQAAILAYREAVRLDSNFAEAKENLADAESQPPAAVLSPARPKADRTKSIFIVLGVGMGLCVLAGLAGLAIVLFVFGRPFLTPKQTVLFEPDRSKVATVTPDDLKKTVEVLKQRWAALGYEYPSVSFTISDQGQIIAQIPTDVDAGLIKRTKAYGLVEFVDFGTTPFIEGVSVNTDFKSDYYPSAAGEKWHTIMTNSEIKSAVVETSADKQYEIGFVLTANGTKTLADFSSKHVGHYLGIVVDKVVVSCPRISGAIMDGSGVINGSFTKETAQDLASILKSPPLPIPLK
ncbi:MAG: hypothetical protein WA821_01250 [Anaerolineales bacterium]